MSLVVVDPSATEDPLDLALAARPTSLEGARVACLVNDRGNHLGTDFEYCAGEIARRLAGQGARIVAATVKPPGHLTRPASAEMLATLTAAADVVVNGIGK